MVILAEAVGSPKVLEKHGHKMANTHRRIRAFVCDIRPAGMGRHG